MTNWENIVEDKELDKAAKSRRNSYNERKDYTSAKDDIESEGWTAISQYANPKYTKYRKEKPIGEQFEDSVWMMFYNMGFYAMNKDNQFSNFKQAAPFNEPLVCIHCVCSGTAPMQNIANFKKLLRLYEKRIIS